MAGTLFLSHRIPFPPDRGDKIRSHHLLRTLAAAGPVHVGTFAETDQDVAQRPALASVAATHWLGRRSKPLPLAGVEALFRGKPVSLTAFDDAQLRRWVAETIKREGIDTIFVFSGQMGQYVPADFAGRVVIDLCDVDSAKFEAYAEAGERPWLNRREGTLLKREEERLAHRADTTLLITANEADLFRSRLNDMAGVNIRPLGNGIDAAFFDPDAVEPHPAIAGAEGPHFAFTGQMDYRPNVAAAQWVIEHLMPVVRQRFANACFHIVGRNPVDELVRYDRQNGIRVWGEVPDVRPFVRAADVVLAPLLIARGVQNKVLEAMAMARPVLLTPEAATGIDAQDGTHFIIERANPAAMLARIDDLISNPVHSAQIGEASRDYILQTSSWPAVLAPLAEIVGRNAGVRDAA